MSTQISSMLEDSIEIFQRIFFLLDEPGLQAFMPQTKDKPGSQQIDRTFEESVIKPKSSNMNKIAARLQHCLTLHIRSENQQAEKYQDQLQALQAKLRKQTKNEIENRLLIEALEQQNIELRKQVLTLKDQIIDLQKALEGTELRMKTQIKTLQSEISYLRKLDHLIWDGSRQGLETSYQEDKSSFKIQKKKTAISQIKNRLSLCDFNDFQANMFDSITPNTQKQTNKTVQHEYEKFNKRPQHKTIKPTSRKSSLTSLTRKNSTKEAQTRQNEKNSSTKIIKTKKNLKLKQLQPRMTVAQKPSINKSASKIKTKK